jgi:hypothetical protein
LHDRITMNRAPHERGPRLPADGADTGPVRAMDNRRRP